jgi:drug/metabolite transporter (DMT)-like permease
MNISDEQWETIEEYKQNIGIWDRSMQHDIKGILAMVATAVCWSLSGLLIKLIDWNPFTIAGARSLIAVLFILAVKHKLKLKFNRDQVIAAVAYTCTMLLFVYANKHTTSANAILLQSGAPIYVMLLSGIMLKEKPLPEQIGALIAIVIGMALFFADSVGLGHLNGDIAAVLAGLTLAIHILFMRKQKEGSPLESLLIGHGLTALIALSISLFLPPPVMDKQSIAAILALGIVQIGFAAFLFSYAIKRISAIQSSLISIVEPALNPLWVYLAIGEKPTKLTIIGGIIILAAVVVSSIYSISREKGNSSEEIIA